MAKHVTLGNGELLVGFDRYGRVQDLHFPYVGRENHVALNHIHHIGVWCEGMFRWFSDPSWQIEVKSSAETFKGEVVAENPELRVKLVFCDVVYNEKNILIRQVDVHNLDESSAERDIRVFFGQQFQIAESRRGDTAYFDPQCAALIHYKGRRAFLINLRAGSKALHEYSVGLFDIEGKEGTFRDAEDGKLEKNPIEHSSVDSIVGIRLSVRGRGKKRFHYWLTAGTSITEVRELNDYILERGPAHLIETTTDYWGAWVNRHNFTFYGLSADMVALFKRSLFVLRAHADNRGAIIASGDSDILHAGRDSYHYMWPRDGARVALALDMAGDANMSKRFFQFCNRIISDEGYFMHKYLPDGSLGSSWHPWLRDGRIELPIQEDETALPLIALKTHYELTDDIEFIESIYNSFIAKAGHFMLGYRYRDTALPYPSYDLWEQCYGISGFTCAAVYGALQTVSYFAKLLGKTEEADRFSRGAETLKRAIEKHFCNPERKMFRKLIRVDQDDFIYDDTLDVASFFGMLEFGVYDAKDKKMREAVETLEKVLLSKTNIGGMPRFEHDDYFRVGNDANPNPWVVTTLWLAQYHLARAKNDHDLEQVKYWLTWVVDHAGPSGMLSEQVNPYTGAHVGATPLAWSHAEYVITVIKYLNKLEELGICKACNPVR